MHVHRCVPACILNEETVMKARVPNSLLMCSPEMQTEETIPLISLHKSMMLRLAYSPERQALCQRQDAAYQDGTISEI